MSHVQRDSTGKINGPVVSLTEDPGRTFVGEVHELMNEVDALVASFGESSELDEDLRRIVDAAIGVGFDYGVEYGRSGRA